MKIVKIIIKISIFNIYFCKHKINVWYNSFNFKDGIISDFCNLNRKRKCSSIIISYQYRYKFIIIFYEFYIP